MNPNDFDGYIFQADAVYTGDERLVRVRATPKGVDFAPLAMEPHGESDQPSATLFLRLVPSHDQSSIDASRPFTEQVFDCRRWVRNVQIENGPLIPVNEPLVASN